jgi:hypothetical protein
MQVDTPSQESSGDCNEFRNDLEPEAVRETMSPDDQLEFTYCSNSVLVMQLLTNCVRTLETRMRSGEEDQLSFIFSHFTSYTPSSGSYTPSIPSNWYPIRDCRLLDGDHQIKWAIRDTA